jgi:hypothetical protein
MRKYSARVAGRSLEAFPVLTGLPSAKVVLRDTNCRRLSSWQQTQRSSDPGFLQGEP